VKRFQYRLDLLALLVFFIFVGLFVRLGYLQILNGDYFSNLADGNRIRLISITAPRGIIYDRYGEVLVTNRAGFSASIVPFRGPIDPEVVELLSNLLDIPKEEIEKKVKQNEGRVDPILVKTDLTDEMMARIEERRSDLPGVVIEAQAIRYYPNEVLGAHVLGYVSEISEEALRNKGDIDYRIGDLLGQSGLERYYDFNLRGQRGGSQIEVDVTGRPIKVLGKKDPVPGNNLKLTLDLSLQKAADQAINDSLTYLASQGNTTQGVAAVALDPRNGQVLAMVSKPSYNPNSFASGISQKEWDEIRHNPFDPLTNKAISGEYPPGSPFKVIAGLAAIEEKKATPEEMYFDSGNHPLAEEKENAGGVALGWINLRRAIQKSNNVYFYEMAYRLGINTISQYSRMFGMGEITGIDLPGESRGLVASREYKKSAYEDDTWYIVETMDAAIGQGFQLTTPLQMAQIVSMVANGGIRYKPYLVQEFTDNDGQVIQKIEPQILETLKISKKNLSVIQEAMFSTTQEDGTAFGILGDFPYKMGAKTGTSENPHGRDHSWFVAYGPLEYPEIVVVVLVEQGGFGSVAAGPIVRQMLDAYFGFAKPQN
jgi:penicillin-binding protein 2